MALISKFSTWVMDLAPAVSRARNSEECRSEKNPDAFVHQLGKQLPAGCWRGCALLIFDRITVWP